MTATDHRVTANVTMTMASDGRIEGSSTTDWAGAPEIESRLSRFYAQNSSTGYGGYCAATQCGGTAAWTNASDLRMKEKISALEAKDGLATIMKLRPVTYHWRDSNMDMAKGAQIGFIAQEVETILPQLVTTSNANTTIHLANGQQQVIEKAKAMDYSGVVVPLVKAVQELKALFDGLAVKLDEVGGKVADMGKQIAALLDTTSEHEKEIKALRDELKAMRDELAAIKKDGVKAHSEDQEKPTKINKTRTKKAPAAVDDTKTNIYYPAPTHDLWSRSGQASGLNYVY
jgi:uncharacterized coiled-coil protein SlyX